MGEFVPTPASAGALLSCSDEGTFPLNNLYTLWSAAGGFFAGSTGGAEGSAGELRDMADVRWLAGIPGITIIAADEG